MTSETRNGGERLVVIANPRAAGGRVHARRDAIMRAVDRAFAHARIVWTEGPGHATEIARTEAPGCDIVAALGGDGTCSEVVNGLVDAAGTVTNPKVVFTVLPLGTGGDLVRTLQIPATLSGALWVASTGMTLPLDLGAITLADGTRRVFVNVLGVGANAEVCARANRSSKRLGGVFTFLPAVLSTALSYRPRPLRWTAEGPEGRRELSLDTLGAFVANGSYCGAGLYVGRDGSMADGYFDVTIVPTVSAAQVPRMLPRLYDGSLGDAPGVVRFRASTLTVEGDVDTEADGELLPPGPVTVRVLPRILQVRAGWLKPPAAPARS